MIHIAVFMIAINPIDSSGVSSRSSTSFLRSAELIECLGAIRLISNLPYSNFLVCYIAGMHPLSQHCIVMLFGNSCGNSFAHVGSFSPISKKLCILGCFFDSRDTRHRHGVKSWLTRLYPITFVVLAKDLKTFLNHLKILLHLPHLLTKRVASLLPDRFLECRTRFSHAAFTSVNGTPTSSLSIVERTERLLNLSKGIFGHISFNESFRLQASWKRCVRIL
jgi:hypothetical protein